MTVPQPWQPEGCVYYAYEAHSMTLRVMARAFIKKSMRHCPLICPRTAHTCMMHVQVLSHSLLTQLTQLRMILNINKMQSIDVNKMTHL